MVPNIGPGLCSDITKEAYNPECLVPTVKHGVRSVIIWEAVSSILLVLYFECLNFCQ